VAHATHVASPLRAARVVLSSLSMSRATLFRELDTGCAFTGSASTKASSSSPIKAK
jgi:hypothetical protein